MRELTPHESRMLANIAKNEINQNGNPTDPVWSNCLDKGPFGEFIPKRSLGGVLASLAKKGLVVTQGKGQDSTVTLTELGLTEAAKLKWTNKGYSCPDCGDRRISETKTNMTCYTEYYVSKSGQIETVHSYEEDTLETEVHWECYQCGYVLPCKSFSELAILITQPNME
jgi:predicted RNA-binding Zn-ribbon protein involved in translation (DUF1610 family)